MSFSLSTLAVNAEADAFGDLLNNGTLECRTDPRPASSDDAATGTLLGAIPLDAADAFDAAVDGVADMQVPVEIAAIDAGTVTWGRFKTSGGASVLDVSINTTTGELIIDQDVIAISDPLKVVSFSYTRPKT